MEKVKGYCIDSDILIDYLRGIERARNFFLREGKETSLWISVVSVVEVYSGEETKNSRQRKFIENFFRNFEIISLDPIIAKQAGELRRDYQQPFADMIIAASAIDHSLALATRNMRHFRSIKNLNVFQPYL